MSLIERINSAAEDEFIIEGRWCVEALLANPHFEVVGVIRAKGTHVDFSAPNSIHLEDHPREEISDSMGFRFHRGLIAVAKRPQSPPDDPFADCLVACINIADPANLGAIIRSAAALGAGGILLPHGKGADVFARKSIRASAGAVFRIPIYAFPNLADIVQKLQQQEDGYEVLGAALGPESRPITEFSKLKPGEKRIIIFGPEDYGLSSHWCQLCDSTFEIPMSNEIDSLNVAASAAIALYSLIVA